MKLKNAALQELYETIVNGTFSFSPYAECPIDKAFRKCDERISESATFAHIKELQDRNDILAKELDEAKSSVEYFKTSRNDWRSRAKHEEEEKIEQVKRADNLKCQVDKVLGENFQLKQDHESDVRVIGKLHSQMVDLEDEKTEQVKRADILKSQRDLLKKELDDLKKDKEHIAHSRIEWFKKATERGRELHDAEEKIRDLNEDRDIWFRNNGEKQAEIAELKKRINSLYGVDSDGYIQRLLDNIRKNCYDQGQTDLWVKLQDVKDMQPNEFDVECECLGDVIDMDLEDFLDAYKKWQEQKETDRMRNYLERFCIGKVCTGCPLHTPDFKCGRGSWFRDMSAEDIKRHYEKAVGHGRYTLKDAKLFVSPSMEGVNKAITEVCANFCKAVRDADIKIKENIPRNSWECTLEAMVEANKDLLDKVCGVKPEEEEHKLEYGDAVRVPWRDYDYMYIGPEEKHIRLFNPKTHTVVFVSPTEKLTYQGSKIVICDENDLRKIWKYIK